MRFSVYKFIHTTIRGQFSQLIIQAGKTAYTNLTEVTNLYEATLKLISVLNGHAHREDEVIHPILKNLNYSEIELLEEEHTASEKKSSQIIELINTIKTECNTEKNEILSEKGHAFYLTLTDYMSMYFNHLYHEEVNVMPFLWTKKTDAELMDLHKAMQATLTANEVLDTISVMFPYMTQAQATMIVKVLKISFPSEFTEMAREIKKALGEKSTTIIFALANVEYPQTENLFETTQSNDQ